MPSPVAPASPAYPEASPSPAYPEASPSPAYPEASPSPAYDEDYIYYTNLTTWFNWNPRYDYLYQYLSANHPGESLQVECAVCEIHALQCYQKSTGRICGSSLGWASVVSRIMVMVCD